MIHDTPHARKVTRELIIFYCIYATDRGVAMIEGKIGANKFCSDAFQMSDI